MLTSGAGNNSLRSRLKKSTLDYENLSSKHDKIQSELGTIQLENLELNQENSSLKSQNSLLKSKLDSLILGTEKKILKVKNVDRIFNSHWIPDSLVCSVCEEKFGIFNRKHHCRKCGHLMCGKCTTEHRMSLLTLELKDSSEYLNVKVCKNCVC